MAVAAVSMQTPAPVNWKTQAYAGGPDSEIVDAGEVKVCNNQPTGVGFGNNTCSSNLDCGTALCISVNQGGGTSSQQCGCGNFERRIDHQQITVCSCASVGNLSDGKVKEDCLPFWVNSIMCKFACKNCFSCEEKTGSDCHRSSGVCTMHKTKCITRWNSEDGSDMCQTFGDEACASNPLCRQHKDNTDKALNPVTKTCVSRLYTAFPKNGDNVRCPLGTKRLVDAYMGSPGNFFDTCVPENLEIENCKYYEWDGDSCKTCEHGYEARMVALTEGNGRIKQNAICVLKDNIYNQHCEVFYHYTTSNKAEATARIKSFKGSVQEHHACARCKDGYEWPIDDNGNVSEYTCEAEYVENSWLVYVDSRYVAGGLSAMGSFLLFTSSRIYMQKYFYWKKSKDIGIDIDTMSN